jgi:hypothetical protein
VTEVDIEEVLLEEVHHLEVNDDEEWRTIPRFSYRHISIY